MMTKKKSLLLQVLLLLGVGGIVIGILMLAGCGDDGIGESNPLEEVTFNGDDYFVTSNVGNITNQEAFDLMVEAPDAISVFLDLIDEVLLRGNFEIDYNVPVEFLEELKADIPDFDAWMMERDLTSEEEILQILELGQLRQATVSHLVEVPEEDIEEMFGMHYAPAGYDFDEVRDEIYNELFAHIASGYSPTEVARLRYEAGLEIFNETLEAAYEQFLTMSSIEVDTNEATDQDSSEVIARINGVDITVGQLFAALSNRLGLRIVYDQLDDMLIAANFSVDPAEVDEMIEAYREEFGEEFDDILSDAGFESEEDLFEYLEFFLLEEAILSEPIAISEERLREIHAVMGATVSGSHILVESYEEAAALITQLQNADDFSELFAELAETYSSCPSGASGGDLGSWERGQMVPEFDVAVFDELEVGEFTDEPVETQFGYHVIYKTGVSGIQEFEDVRSELEAQEVARLRQTGEAFNMILAPLRQDAELEFSDPVLQTRFEFLGAE